MRLKQACLSIFNLNLTCFYGSDILSTKNFDEVGITDEVDGHYHWEEVAHSDDARLFSGLGLAGLVRNLEQAITKENKQKFESKL